MTGKALLKIGLGKNFTLMLLGISTVFVQPYRPLVFMGKSMEPTYPAYSVTATTPVEGALHRGDVVVVENDQLGVIVKRIAYVAGDKVPQLNIHGEWVDLYDINLKTASNRSEFREYVIPKGYVYLLGDNRNVSLDSRVFGCIPTSDIKRVVVHPREYVEPPAPKPVPSFLLSARYQK